MRPRHQIQRRAFMLGGLSGSAALAVGAATQSPNTAPSVVTSETGIPRRAATAIEDMLVHVGRIQSGQRVTILSYLDGLYGGDNLVDRDAVHWIQRAVEAHGAKPNVVWIDEPAVAHHWVFPEAVRKALDESDMMVYHSFDLTTEEILDFERYATASGKIAVRNFASTAPLLCTDWALTPYELVSEIRLAAAKAIQAGVGRKFEITEENGTHLEGTILPARSGSPPTYAQRRGKGAISFPEWVHPPISLGDTSGVYVFDRMLGWWARYVGTSPYLSEPIRLAVEKNRIVRIEGGSEAESLRRFLEEMRARLGDGVYGFDTLHTGVHPHAEVQPHQCPSLLYRRLIEHAHSRNLHVHIGGRGLRNQVTREYPYWMHCTADIRSATFRVGDTLIQDKGRLSVLDSPEIREFAAKYPGRPGV